MSLGGNQEIFITVRVEGSDYFRPDGADVHTDAVISLSQAILGGIIRIEGLYEDLNLRIPPGTSSHTILTLSERGFKKLDIYGGQGDHYVHLKIRIPINLTQEQKELIKEYAYTEVNTPGVINGIDKNADSPFKRKKKEQQEEKLKEELYERFSDSNKDTTKDPEENEGFLSKLKKKIFG